MEFTMTINFYLFYVVLLLYSNNYVLGNLLSSLTFVIDDTSSMSDDIESVKIGVKEIFKTVLWNKDVSQIDNFILVTFNDHSWSDTCTDNGTLRAKTKDESDFMKGLNDIDVNGGAEDCAECAMAGIKLGLEESLPRSSLYIFTDATAKDYKRYEEIKQLAQRKQCQIVFVLTGLCGEDGRGSPKYQVYEDIARDTGGNVFHIDEHSINKVLDYVKLTLTGRMVNNVTKVEPGYTNITMNADPLMMMMGEILFSLSSIDPNPSTVAVTGPDGTDVWMRVIFEKDQSKAYAFNATKIGPHTIQVHSTVSAEAVVSAKSGVDFVPGFSSFKLNSILDTSALPVPGAKTHLLINLNQGNITLKSVQILDIDGKMMKTLPLELVNVSSSLYTTQEFDPPTSPFKIAIVGYHAESGSTITRIAPTPVVPIIVLPGEKINNKRPSVLIEGESTLHVNYNDPLTLTCKTEAYPAPSIVWKKTGKVLSSKVVPGKIFPYDYVNQLSLEKVSEIATYVCEARNSIDSDSKQVAVEIIRKMQIIRSSTSNVSVTYEKEVSMFCEVDAYPFAEITWYKDGAILKASDNVKTAMSRNSSISYSTLTIKKSMLADRGKYTCVARNDKVSQSADMNLYIVGLEAPVIDKNITTVTALQGTRTIIECKMLQGKPKPSLRWSFKSTTSARSRTLDRWDNQEQIVIENCNISDSGTYQCVAENDVTSDQHEIQLFVRIPATITPPKETNLTFMVNQRRKRLTCQAAGVPRPDTSWMYQDIDARLPPREITKFRGYSLLVLELVKLSDEGKYTCVANNSAGTSRITYDVLVFDMPQIDKSVETNVSVRKGLSKKLECKILKGKPQPSIRWFFRLAKGDKDAPENLKLISEWNDRQIVTVVKAQKRHSGTYQCQAKNEISDDNFEINLRVEYPPMIRRAGRSIIKQRIGSKAVIPCDVDGSPPPSVTWLKDDVELSNDGRPYRFEPRALTFVVNPSHEGRYTCRATNKLSSDSRTVIVTVTDAATIIIPKERNFTVPVGDRVTLTCRTKGFPAPAIQWYYQSFSSDAKIIIPTDKKTYLNLRNIQLREEGRYTCVATNVGGSMKLTYAVQVLVPVTIVNINTEQRFVVVEGDLALQINCTATGNPKPTITWTKDGSALTFGSIYSVESGALIIRNIPKKASGSYQCEAENPRGKDQMKFEVFVHVPATITPPKETNLTFMVNQRRKRLTCQAAGVPRPDTSWMYQDIDARLPPREITKFRGYSLLVLELVKLSDEGKYTCVANNSAGTSRITYDVLVFDMPQIDKSVETNVSVRKGLSKKLECKILKGKPQPSIRWFFRLAKGDKDAPENLKLISEWNDRQIVTVVKAQKRHSGTYQCQAKNEISDDNFEINLRVEYPPMIRRAGRSIIKQRIGSKAVIPCDVDGSPPPSVTWLKDDVELSNDGRPYRFEPRALTFVVNPSHEGRYTCRATNKLSSDSRTVIVTVTDAATIIIPKERNFTVPVGDRVTLTCRTKGFPAPAIQWYYQSFSSDAKIIIPTDKKTYLNLRNIQLREEGRYTCVATNVGGSMKLTYAVQVLVPVTIVNINTEQRFVVVEGDLALQINCTATGNPKPTITWTKDGSALTFGSIYSVESGALIIRNIPKKASGSYQCEAENPRGKDQMKFEVFVHVPATITPPKETNLTFMVNQRRKRLTCQAAGVPRPDTSWMYQDIDARLPPREITKFRGYSLLVLELVKLSDEGKYTCVANNSAGTSRITYDVLVFDMPQIDKSVETNVSVRKGLSKKLECKILKGKPQPSIRWFFRLAKGDKDAPENLKLISEWNDRQIVTVVKAQKRHSGTYQCQAKNEISDDNFEINLRVEYPPMIRRAGRSIIKQRIGSKAVIPCDVDGSPPPSVTWLKDDVELSNDGRPYRFEPRALTFVVNPSHEGRYTCRATNKLSSDSRTVIVTVTDAATIIIPKERNFTVPVGDRVTLTCRTKGFPAPAIQWYYQSFSSDAKIIIPTDKKTYLNLRNIQLREEGRYTCVATNVGGSMKLTYAVQVLVPVTIVNINTEQRFVVVEGDLALQINCTATGNPKPTITWTKDGSALTFGSIYSVESGALIIRNIPKKASGSYQCEAENPRGKDQMKFEVFVHDYPLYTPPVSKIVLEQGQTKEIKCPLPNKHTDQLRWYKNGVFIQSGDLLIIKASPSDSDYYSCRVSTPSKSYSSALEVFVGYRPTFIRDENENVDMLSSSPVSLNCESNGVPDGNITWYFDGKKLDLIEPIYNFPSGISKSGEYKCEVKNMFGEISRKFIATPGYCVIRPSTSVTMQKQAPLIMDSKHSWLTTNRLDEDLTIPKNTMVYFFCPRFTKFPGSYVVSFCQGGSTFLIQGKEYHYFDVKCQDEIKTTARRTGTKCMPGNQQTEKIRMIYDVLTNITEIVAFEVCMNWMDETPIYTKQTMLNSLADDEFEAEWLNGNEFEMNIKDAYECSNQVDSITNILQRPFHTDDDCCFSKRQLVSPRDVFPGPPQRATYSYYNVVPHWGTCGTSDKNWNDVGQQVRNLAKNMYSELLVWTGVAGQLTLRDYYGKSSDIFISDFSEKNYWLPVPLFLWKVIQDPSSASSLAIVQVNVPDLTREEVSRYIRCDDVCERVAWMSDVTDWREVRKGYTYCCTIQEFERKFGFKGVFEPNMNKLLKRWY